MTIIILIYIIWYLIDKKTKKTALKKGQFEPTYIEPKKAC